MVSGFDDPEAIGTHCPWTREASLARFRIQCTTASRRPAANADERQPARKHQPSGRRKRPRVAKTNQYGVSRACHAVENTSASNE